MVKIKRGLLAQMCGYVNFFSGSNRNHRGVDKNCANVTNKTVLMTRRGVLRMSYNCYNTYTR